MSCEYEQIRLRNIEDNKRILKELGLLNPFNPLPRVIKKAPTRKRARSPDSEARPAKKVVKEVSESGSGLEDCSPAANRSRRRRSSRIRGIDTDTLKDEDEDEDYEIEAEEDEDDEDGATKRKFPKDRPISYGAVQGVEVGTVWQMRSDCSYAGIHRPWVAGIHGGTEGAYSIALSGGYEDDIDMGDCFTYTGEGGRDLKGTRTNPKNLRTAPQSKDQSLTKGNLALVKSMESGNYIRVIRGYKSRGPFAPGSGYRYDGLYKVQKYWFTTGTSGFGVYKFAFLRHDNQAPPPWTFEGIDPNNNKKSDDGDGADNNDKMEKLQKMMERDGLVYDPNERKKVDRDTDSEIQSGTTVEVENEIEEKSCSVEESRTEANMKEVEIEVVNSCKVNDVEIPSKSNKVENEDEENSSKVKATEVKPENDEQEIKMKVDSEAKDVDVEKETDTESERSDDDIEESTEGPGKANIINSESDCDVRCSQDSGFDSQVPVPIEDNITKDKESESESKDEAMKYELKVTPSPGVLTESNTSKNDQVMSEAAPGVKTSKTEGTTLKSGNKVPEMENETPKTPKSEIKMPKTSKSEIKMPKTPKSEIKMPKRTSKKKFKTMLKGKQLTLIDMFKLKL